MTESTVVFNPASGIYTVTHYAVGDVADAYDHGSGSAWNGAGPILGPAEWINDEPEDAYTTGFPIAEAGPYGAEWHFTPAPPGLGELGAVLFTTVRLHVEVTTSYNSIALIITDTLSGDVAAVVTPKQSTIEPDTNLTLLLAGADGSELLADALTDTTGRWTVSAVATNGSGFAGTIYQAAMHSSWLAPSEFPTRLYPRDDHLGESPRVFPPPRSRQSANRLNTYY